MNQRFRKPMSAAYDSGFTLFELILSLVVIGFMVTIAARNSIAGLDTQTTAKATSDLKLIGEASRAYIASNSSTTGSLYTMGANTITLTVADLQAGTSCGTSPCLTSTITFSPPGTAAGNSYIVRINRTGIAPNFTYVAAVMTSRAWISGGVTRLDLAGTAARALGTDGLISYTSTTMDTVGSSGLGAAVLNNTNFPEIIAIGQLGFFVSGGVLNQNDALYVRRDGLFPMTGGLNMAGNDLISAGSIGGTSLNASGGVTAGSVTAGGAITASTLNASAGITGNTVTASSMTATGTITSAGATINGPITANGNVTVASGSDITITDLSGTNKRVSARLARSVPMSQSLFSLTGASLTASVSYPTCSSGGTPQLQLTNNVAVGGNYSSRWGLQVQTIAGAGSWTLNLFRGDGTQPTPADPDTVNGVAVVYCAY